MPALTLLVLRCADIERTRAFSEALGLAFTCEQHGTGPTHYATTLGALVLELYPRRDDAALDHTRIGLAVDAPSLATTSPVRDPDGRLVETPQRP